MEINSLWVIAFDKETGERVNITVCPKNNVPFYEAKYRMEGYEPRIFTNEEIDELIEQEECKK